MNILNQLFDLDTHFDSYSVRISSLVLNNLESLWFSRLTADTVVSKQLPHFEKKRFFDIETRLFFICFRVHSLSGVHLLLCHHLNIEWPISDVIKTFLINEFQLKYTIYCIAIFFDILFVLIFKSKPFSWVVPESRLHVDISILVHFARYSSCI